MATEIEIDDSLYSRQRYVLGDSAMQRMARASVLVCGLGGLGVEIAKNIVLAGIKSLSVQDGRVTTTTDLGTQFFLRPDDVAAQRTRAEASAPRLSELNPYVSIYVVSQLLNSDADLTYMTDFQCVILTEVPLHIQLKVNWFCRQQSIKFISADVYGIASSIFCDFGDEFEVVDPNGEEPKEVFISDISKANPGVVKTLDNKMHGFEPGDLVTFKEINGMTLLNEKTCKIQVQTPYAFSICDTSGDEFQPYQHGGVARQVKIPLTCSFKSLESQIRSPTLQTPDLCKFEAPGNIHLGFLALHKFQEQFQRLPNVRCAEDAGTFVKIACDLNNELENKVEPLDHEYLKSMSFTSRGCFAPLCAVMGGFVAQEGLKALTGKFTPLNQWLCLDAAEVTPSDDNSHKFQPRGDIYDSLRICIGQNMLTQLADVKLFMVGCGAIGCEMLKNYAMLGVATGESGLITITDNDLIEKSNLNRQFLFRPRHIRQPKSTTAAAATKEINPAVRIEAQQHKVCPQTEDKVYNDAFFRGQDLIVNALDNVEARRYMDSRCVTNQRALLESGTMATKGHVQVIIPHMTESYTSQQDPHDEDFPYCTVKSFPATIEHCIQWARDKFESSFVQKPAMFNKFWSSSGHPHEVIKKLQDGSPMAGAVLSCKVLKARPTDWPSCVALSRCKFEKYFNHKAKNLLHAFPMDTKLKDGTLFWQSPKRPPTPIEFDLQSELHMLFLISTAKLYAHSATVSWTEQDCFECRLQEILSAVNVPAFRPSNKIIEVDESAQPEAPVESGNELDHSAKAIEECMQRPTAKIVFTPMQQTEFEKDDDSNSHIDCITSSANLRAQMYSIELADRLKIKRIAGRIVPAIATTTAAVAGLVTIELLKIVQKQPIEKYKNCFLNLALPLMLLTEPGCVARTVIKEGLTYTLWDKWEVKGDKNFTMQQFIDSFRGEYEFSASMVVQGAKMIYVPFMPAHRKRLPQTMIKLLKPSPGQVYTDLLVCFQDDQEEDVPGPPVRYFFGL